MLKNNINSEENNDEKCHLTEGCGCKCHHSHHDDHGHDNDHDHCHHDEDGCSCGHCHGEHKRVSLWVILRYSIGGIAVIAAFLPFIPQPIRIILALVAYAVFGIEVWKDMIVGFTKRRIFTEFTLMSVASLGAFLIGEYADGAAIVYLYSLGELLSDSIYSRSKRNISELLEIAPEFATVLRDGQSVRIPPHEVRVGELMVVGVGERVALDGIVISGHADADTSSVTGESAPLDLYEGISCPSGAVVLNGCVTLKAVADYDNSVVSKLTRAVEEASERKAKAEKKISRFARVFTPAAFGVSIVIALVGGLISQDAITWIRAGIAVLVVSCPCALVLSVPLTYFAGIGAAAGKGIIFRGGEVMDALCRVRAVAFDKTGTVTESDIRPCGVDVYGDADREEFISLARDVLGFSSHGTAISFCKAYPLPMKHKIENVEIIGGRGVVCEADGKRTLFGNAALMRENGIDAADSKTTAIFGARDGRLLGRIDFKAQIKKNAKETVSDLRKKGIERIAIISGDVERAVADTCGEAGIDEFHHSVTPHGKAELFEKIMEEEKKKHKGCTVAYCGDGLNDSAVIAMADVGVAMGKSGAALTVESADIVLMDDNIERLSDAIAVSKRTSVIATQNIVISIGIKAAVVIAGIVLSVLGKNIPLEIAVAADVGASLLAVLNAVRAFERKKNNEKGR